MLNIAQMAMTMMTMMMNTQRTLEHMGEEAQDMLDLTQRRVTNKMF